jgi:hypothetical protein
MHSFTVAALVFLMTGSYLFFWPAYRAFHPKSTRRRQALFRLFLLELCIYLLVTGSLVIAVYRLPDFHQGGFLIVEVLYLLLLVFFWAATYGVWADYSPYVVES